MSWIIWILILLVILAFLMLIYFVRQPYSLYKLVSQKGYRKITIFEGDSEVDVPVPYLLTDENYKVDLSIVVPCYNECSRFPPTLKETYKYLEDLTKREKLKIEMVLVNDGSKDGTWDMIKKLSKDYQHDEVVKIRGVSVNPNSGKGNAVRMGFLYSKGKQILMIDADGATEISDYERLSSYLKDSTTISGEGIAIGSRRKKAAGIENKIERTFIRNFVSKVFNILTRILIGLSIEDTQCGFKLFTRKSARIVTIQHLERWSFDCELLYIAGQKRIPVEEVPVTWHEVEGDAKISVLTDSLKMLRDIIAIRFLYTFRFWKLSDSLTK